MSDLFRIALGQMTVAETGTENLAKAVSLMKRAADAGARLLVLPEGVIARKPTDGAWSRKHAEPLDGPFVSGLLAATADIPIAVSCTVHEPSGAPDGRVWNTHIVADGGKLLAAYRKLHLYDAFSGLESANVVPGEMHDMCAAFLSGDVAAARALQFKVLPLWKAAFCEVNPIAIKTMASMMGPFTPIARATDPARCW